MNGEQIINTGRVQIGLRAARPGPRLDFSCAAPDTDMLGLQSALAGRGAKFSEQLDWDGIFIAGGCIVAVATALLWFWSR